MIGQRLVQAVADEPADRDIHQRLPHQPAVVHDPEQKAGKKAHRHLGINARPTVIGTVEVRYLLAQPIQIENAITRARM